MEKDRKEEAKCRTSKGKGKVFFVKVNAEPMKKCLREGVLRRECIAHRFPKKAEKLLANLYCGWTNQKDIGLGDERAWLRDFERHGLIESAKKTVRKKKKARRDEVDNHMEYCEEEPASEESTPSRRRKHYRIDAYGLVSLVFEEELNGIEYVSKRPRKRMRDARKEEKIRKLIDLLMELFDTDEARNDYWNHRNADMRAGKKQPIDVVEWMRETLFNVWMLSYVLLRNGYNNAYSRYSEGAALSSLPSNNVDKYRKELETKKKVESPMSIARFLLACQLTDQETSSLLRTYYADYHGLDECWNEIQVCGDAVKLGTRSSL